MSEKATISQTMQMVPFAHQREFVEQVVNSSSPGRFYLASQPGAGKMTALAFLAGDLKAKKSGLRSLFIVPAPLTAIWQDHLKRVVNLDSFIMTPQSYRRLQAEVSGDLNIWSTISCVVVSIDFFNSPDRVKEALVSQWDLVILDGVYNFTKSTQRGQIIEEVWNAASAAIAVAAAPVPHRTDWSIFDAKTTFIGSNWQTSSNWHPKALTERGILPKRINRSIDYVPTELDRMIANGVHKLFNCKTKDKSAQIMEQFLTRRLKSSIFAYELSLRRLLSPESVCDTDQFDWAINEIEDTANPTAIHNTFQINREIGEQILALIESQTKDIKSERLFNVINLFGYGKTHSAIIFTEYTDTGEYLSYLARDRGLSAFLIISAAAPEVRARTLEEARGTPSLLIVTGTIKGMNLSFTDQVFNYDMPSDLATWYQRIAQVGGMNTGISEVTHYFLLDSSLGEDSVFACYDRESHDYVSHLRERPRDLTSGDVKL